MKAREWLKMSHLERAQFTLGKVHHSLARKLFHEYMKEADKLW